MWDYWSLFLRRKISEAESKKSSFTLLFISLVFGKYLRPALAQTLVEYISKSAVNLGITYPWVIISIIYTFTPSSAFLIFTDPVLTTPSQHLHPPDIFKAYGDSQLLSVTYF